MQLICNRYLDFILGVKTLDIALYEIEKLQQLKRYFIIIPRDKFAKAAHKY